MENASKALLMAGGVLISIIIIGVLILGYNQWRAIPQEQEEALKTEQLAKFNREYEAYNKQKLYGTDIISVINKAVSNNKKYENDESVYDIDIVFVLSADLASSANVYTQIPEGMQTDPVSTGRIVYKDGKDTITYNFSDQPSFKAGTQFNLIAKENAGPDTDGDRMNDNVVKILSLPETFRIEGSNVLQVSALGGKVSCDYVIIDSGFKQFKRSMFSCENVTYDMTTGRVKQMTFIQI